MLISDAQNFLADTRLIFQDQSWLEPNLANIVLQINGPWLAGKLWKIFKCFESFN